MSGKEKSSQKSENGESIKLADFVGSQQLDGIAYRFMDYLELADWTGRAVRDDKAGYIP